MCPTLRNEFDLLLAISVSFFHDRLVLLNPLLLSAVGMIACKFLYTISKIWTKRSASNVGKPINFYVTSK